MIHCFLSESCSPVDHVRVVLGQHWGRHVFVFRVRDSTCFWVPKLVLSWARTLLVDCWYLSHNMSFFFFASFFTVCLILSIATLFRTVLPLVSAVVFTLAVTFRLGGWTAGVLVSRCWEVSVTSSGAGAGTGTSTVVAFIMLAVKSIVAMRSRVRLLRSHCFHAIEISSFICKSDVFKALLQTVYSILIRGKEPVTSIHPQLTLSHLLCLFDLIRVQGHRCHYVNTRSTVLSVGALTLGLLVIFFHVGALLLVCSFISILLGNLVFHLCDRIPLELLADLFLFTLPLVLNTVWRLSLTFPKLVLSWGQRRLFFRYDLWQVVQIEKSIIKDCVLFHLFGNWFLYFDFNLLIGAKLFLVDERTYSFDQRDFVVQRRGANYIRSTWLTALSRCRGCHISQTELINNVRSRVFEDD